MLLYINVFSYTIKIVIRKLDFKLSKIREKKLNSIKSEMEEIKRFIVSSKDLSNTEESKIYYSNINDENTVTLTKIVNKENKLDNDNNLVEIKKELQELKKAININKILLSEILSKIK